MSAVLVKRMEAPPFREREALRYAGCAEAREEILEELGEALAEVRDRLDYRVCYCELPLTVRDDRCEMGELAVASAHLAKALSGCERVLLFGATIGVEIDRLIAKYGRLAPAKGLLLQAVGAERIEALCDAFCKEYEKENDVSLGARFSAGYGDCPLETQRDIVRVLDCQKRIGLFLNESLLLSPSKSVTAFVGIKENL